jgi:hypothetical protein
MLLMVGCSTIKYVPIQGETVVEYRDTTIYINDTVTIPVPVEVVKEVVPADTVSVLQTSVALSEAKIQKGMLHHSLEQRGTVKTRIDTVVTIQYVDKYIYEEVPVTVEVEKRYVPEWCWWSLIINIVTVLLVAFRIYLKHKRVA